MDIDVAIVPYFLNVVAPYAVIGGVWYVALRFVQAYERRRVRVEEYYALTERVRILEDGLDRVEDRVDRSDEVQRFTTSVLAARLTNGNR
jgi:hypothetical protein